MVFISFNQNPPRTTMLDQKTIAMLSTLSRKEWNDFGQYLQIKKGSNSQLFSIYKYLLRYNDNLDNSKVSIEHLTKHLKLAHQKLTQNQIYRFRESLVNFLVIEQILAPPKKEEINVLKEKVILKILQERGLNKQLNNSIQKVKKKLHANPRDRWYHLHLLELYDLEYFHSETEKINKKKAHIHIADAARQSNLFFDALKLRYGAELLSRNQILDEKNPIDDIEELIQKLSLQKENVQEYHALFSSVFEMIKTGKEEAYHSLLIQFEKNYRQINIHEQQTIFSYLVNFCIQQIQKNNLKYVKEIASLYDFGLSKSILLDGKILPSTRFCNMIDLLAKNGEFQRAQQFIKDYSKNLKTQVRKESIAIAHSIIYFEKEEYAQVMLTLSRIKSFSLADNDLRARWLQLCSFYEGGDIVPLESYVKATKEFLRRNKHLGVKHKKGTLNLIKFIEYLSVPSFHKKRKTKVILIKELQQMDIIFFKAWILKKIDLL